MTTLTLKTHLDPTGFPMLEIPGTNYALSWLPITKIQFEHFLCDTNLFNDSWYFDLLQKSPRVAPSAIRLSDYWNLFITEILPPEAVRFANWLGRDYRLPTAQEWKASLLTLANYPAKRDYIDAVLQATDESKRSINERAAIIIRNLEEVTPEDTSKLVSTNGRCLCDQMLMRLGVIEYVYEDNQWNSFAGWGQPNTRLYGNAHNPIRDTRPIQLVDRSGGTRSPYFGFRILRRLR